MGADSEGSSEEGEAKNKASGKTPQKSPGWIPAPRSAKRPPPTRERRVEDGHSNDFGMYMANKVRKIREQYEEQAAWQADIGLQSDKAVHRSNLFSGVSIHVNGFTKPSHSELRELMAQHGGNFENYYTRALVTHIICSNLPDAKIREFSKGHPPPIVRPEWVTDSLQAGRLLPVSDYQLERLQLQFPGQRMLRAVLPTANAAYNASSEARTVALQDVPSCDQVGTAISAQQQEQEMRSSVTNDAHAPATSMRHPGSGPHPLPHQASNVLRPTMPVKSAQQVAADARAACALLKGNPKTSKDDPNFVENFHKASRLHFIGTWKARFQALSAAMAGMHAGSTPSNNAPRCIMHIDMDSFFASIAMRDYSELTGKCVAICHSNFSGSAEISSANYEARKFGIKAGMFMSSAKSMCPELVVMPYEFDKYAEASEAMYRVLLSHTLHVQALSCDEAFLDISGLGDPSQLAAKIRTQIQEATGGLTASAGISHNMLLARLATKRAKPNGQYHLTMDEVEQYMGDLPVRELPGIGWSLRERLEVMGITQCKHVLAQSKAHLQRELGDKTGVMLYQYARGVDNRELKAEQQRKSIGADVNWGVRFTRDDEVSKFIEDIAKEVCSRLREAGVKSRTITLKVKRKKLGAPEPAKFMGCGICDSFSRSVTLASFTDDPAIVGQEAKQLYSFLKIPPSELRGVGLQMTRLSNDTSSSVAKPSSSVTRGRLGAPKPSVWDQTVPSWMSGMQLVPSAELKVDEGLGDSDDDSAAEAAEPEREVVVDVNPNHRTPPPAQEVDALDDNLDKERAAPAADDATELDGSGAGLILTHHEGCAAMLRKERGKALLIDATPGEVQIQTIPQPRPASARQLFGASTSAATMQPAPSASMQMLPPISELDPSVMAELPPDVLDELKSEYHRQREVPAPSEQEPSSIGNGRALSAPPHVDPSVWAALPDHIRSEYVAALPCHNSPKPLPPVQVESQKPVEPQPVSPPLSPFPSQTGHGTSPSIEQLPPSSQLDPSVLDALPLVMRREIERAYEQQQQQQSGGQHSARATRASSSRRGRRGSSNKAPPGRSPAQRGNRQVVPSPVATDRAPLAQHAKAPVKDVAAPHGPNQKALAAPQQPAATLDRKPALPTSISQVDKAVWAQLPAEVRADLAASLGASTDPQLKPSTSRLEAAPIKMCPEQKLCEGRTMFASEDIDGVRTVLARSMQELTGSSLLDAEERMGAVGEITAQYLVELVQTNLEETQRVIRFMRRFAFKHAVWQPIYDKVLQAAQICVHRLYGGSLAI
eukprot:jgi/Chlat1/5582/Chrsp369S05362